MPAKKIKKFLDDNNIKYVTLQHSPAYTAQEIAASAHIPGKELAKTVMIRVGPKMVMLVLPASYRIDFGALREAMGFADIRLATEEEFKTFFPDCEVGAMPPFGNLYDLPVYVAESLTFDEDIAFNAGSHKELIKMSYVDFERLVDPEILTFSKKTE